MKTIEKIISYPAFNLTSLLTRDDEFDNDDFSICNKKKVKWKFIAHIARCVLL